MTTAPRLADHWRLDPDRIFLNHGSFGATPKVVLEAQRRWQDALEADYYTANHHKWLCGPKVSGFLFVQRRWQEEVRPTVISHAANRPRPARSKFIAEFDWNGTYDPTPLLATEAALTFLEGLLPGGLDELQQQNRRLALAARQCLADRLGIPLPAPDAMIGSLATLPLPAAPPSPGAPIDALQRHLRDVAAIEVPIFAWPSEGSGCLRISAQAYNRLDQYQRLAEALDAALWRAPAPRR
jgi:isopenicillin-N epimerase